MEDEDSVKSCRQKATEFAKTERLVNMEPSLSNRVPVVGSLLIHRLHAEIFLRATLLLVTNWWWEEELRARLIWLTAPTWDKILSMTCSRFLLCNMTRTSQDVMAPPQIQLILTFFGQQTENQCFIPRGLSVNLFCLNILSDLCKRIMEPIITKFLNYENIRCVYSTKFTKNHRRICTIFGWLKYLKNSIFAKNMQ